jgi:hypothetical protein
VVKKVARSPGDAALLAVDLKNLHGDPADRFIVSTAIMHDAILVTADARLLLANGPQNASGATGKRFASAQS